ncbi:MAG: formylglycine-generating enzyme family protein [Nitrospirota bacterium]|nr:formylglycine-generating enzyme family protein [Nitrospirota bacterium]
MRARIRYGWLGALLLAGCVSSPPVQQEAAQGMVYIPGGPFIMGQNAEDGQVGVEVGIDSLPRHRVWVESFWIDRTEVSVGEYRTFVKATGHAPFPAWAWQGKLPEDNLPALAVNWFDARDYCAWRGKRLPSEAEWEKAARGTDGRIYPWGNELDLSRVVSLVHGRLPDPVGSHPDNASPYGVLDMAGNVIEWTDSWYQAHPGSELERQAFGERYKVMKGGSWGAPEMFLRSANRYASLAELGAPAFGFRCAKSRHP